jgi:hypothetical protein
MNRSLRRRDSGCPEPPPQTRTCSFPASGSSVVLAFARATRLRKHQFVLQAARLGDAGFGDTKLFDGATEGRPGETLTLTPAPVQPLERIGDGRIEKAPQVRRVAP